MSLPALETISNARSSGLRRRWLFCRKLENATRCSDASTGGGVRALQITPPCAAAEQNSRELTPEALKGRNTVTAEVERPHPLLKGTTKPVRRCAIVQEVAAWSDTKTERIRR